MITLSFDIKKWVPAIILLWITAGGCTKLDVKTYSVLPAASFWSDPANIPAGKAPVYNSLGQIVGHSGVGNMLEITSDEMVYPTRGTDWYDGGQWARMYYHQGLPSDVDGNIDGNWQAYAGGAGLANSIIYELQNLPAGADPALTSDLAEMVAVRSFFYYKGMEMFGNIPYVTDFKIKSSLVVNVPMKAVFDSLVNDLTAVIPSLSKTVGPTTYGKANRYMAEALLAKLYLNAKYFTGGAEDHFTDCIAVCNDIINSGNYSLESNYFNCFYGVNNTSPENIFVAPMGTAFINSNGIVQATIQFNSAETFGIPCCNYGNNGASTTHDLYQYFDTSSTYTTNTVTINGRTVNNRLRTFNDQRTGSYLIGQQFQGDGVSNYPPSKNWVVANNDYCCTYNGDTSQANTTKIGDYYNSQYSPVVYYDTVNEFVFSTSPAYFRHAGLRNIKYWPQPGQTNGNMSNAWAIYRLADIYLIRGEAEYWTGDLGDALTDFNTIRARAYGNTSNNWTSGQLTPDNILQERARELSWEDTRRSDQIRMQYMTGTPYYTRARNYPPKPADAVDNHTFLLPIPTVEINNNTNLKQNPGY